MKKMICAILVLMLVLTGCQGAVTETAAPVETTPPAPGTDTPATEGTQPEVTFPTLPEGGFSSGPVMGGQEGELLPFANAGKVRLNYEGNRSYVRYVTSVDQLPPESAWEGYDEAYFQTKALLIVVETLNSGSVQVELDSIRLDGNTASVVIERTMSGDVGTTDMATWMLWAEVDKGLECEWTLANASQLPQGEKY
jgi:hypothetical protein